MHQHFEQGLVTDALACRELSRLRYVKLGQAQRYLNIGDPVQPADKARSLWCDSPLERSGRFLLYKLATLATGPPVRLFSFIRKLRHVNRFPFHHITPRVPAGPGSPSSAPHPGHIRLRPGSSRRARPRQWPPVAPNRFRRSRRAEFPLHVLFIDRDWTVRQALFHFFWLDPMSPDLA